MEKTVDSYRFLDGFGKRVMRHWAGFRTGRKTPWTPLVKPLSKCRVSIVSSAALALASDRPFDHEIERRDPWHSDPSYRVIPRTTKTGESRSYHLHINTSFAHQDLNSVMPLERLNELARLGEIGSVAQSHYSYGGYTLRPETLLTESVPAIIRRMREEEVDAVLLVPV